MTRLPDLSRFEMQCLRLLWARREASVREIERALGDGPTYSTVRKIIERLEEKGAIERVRKEGRAWIYRSAVAPSAMIRKEVKRFLEGVFGGSAAPLVSYLAEMDEITVDDLREAERQLRQPRKRPSRRGKRK